MWYIHRYVCTPWLLPKKVLCLCVVRLFLFFVRVRKNTLSPETSIGTYFVFSLFTIQKENLYQTCLEYDSPILDTYKMLDIYDIILGIYDFIYYTGIYEYVSMWTYVFSSGNGPGNHDSPNNINLSRRM